VAQNRREGKAMGDRITICGGCRPGEGEALADGLRAALAQAGLTTEVGVVDCMVVCAKPVSVAVRAEGKAAYLFSGVDPAAQGAEIVAFARLYAEAAGGIIADARPCGELRFRLVGRLPA
jgi:predicted metal-binding protein